MCQCDGTNKKPLLIAIVRESGLHVQYEPKKMKNGWQRAITQRVDQEIKNINECLHGGWLVRLHGAQHMCAAEKPKNFRGKISANYRYKKRTIITHQMNLTIDTSGEVHKLHIPRHHRLSMQFAQRFLGSNDLIAETLPGYTNVYFIYAQDALGKQYPRNVEAARRVGSHLFGNVIILQAAHLPGEIQRLP